MITMLPAEQEVVESGTAPSTIAAPHLISNTSFVAENLIRIVRGLRFASSALVPKSCLLAGPPGVGSFLFL